MSAVTRSTHVDRARAIVRIPLRRAHASFDPSRPVVSRVPSCFTTHVAQFVSLQFVTIASQRARCRPRPTPSPTTAFAPAAVPIRIRSSPPAGSPGSRRSHAPPTTREYGFNGRRHGFYGCYSRRTRRRAHRDAQLISWEWHTQGLPAIEPCWCAVQKESERGAFDARGVVLAADWPPHKSMQFSVESVFQRRGARAHQRGDRRVYPARLRESR